MLNRKNIFEIIKTALILFLITAISSGLLAIVNNITAPVIAENTALNQKNAMKSVLPNADEFETENDEFKNYRTEQADKTITAVYKSKNNSGYVVMASPTGYGGKISLAIGVSLDGKVTGVKVISHSETAGLGANCEKDEFLKQYIGKAFEITVSKNNTKDNQINAISSATITSKAVTNGVNFALAAVKSAKEAN